MTEMLLLAKRNLKFLNRELEYLKKETDEDYLVSACFYTHMIIELSLKHLLEINGLPCNYTHQLKTLIKACTANELPIPKQVLVYYVDMKDWCTEARYNINFKGDQEIVKKLWPILIDWLLELEQCVEIQGSNDDDLF